MQKFIWFAVCFAVWSLPVAALALRYGSGNDHVANSDEATVIALPQGHSQDFVLPVPTGFVGDLAVKATSLNPRVASASATAVLDHQRVLLRSGPAGGLLQCKVASVCHAPGHANFRLDFAPVSRDSGMSPTRPVFLTKTCSADVLQGFNVGQEPNGRDVVKDGQPQWTRQHEPEFGRNVDTVDLHVSLADSSIRQQMATPIVRTTAVRWGSSRAGQLANTADAGAGSIVQVQVLSDLDQGELSQDTPKTLRLAFRCITAGIVRLELTLSPKLAWEPYRPVPLWFTKTCGGGFKKGFQVGSKAGVNDLVADGVVKGHPGDIDGLTDRLSLYIKYAPRDAQDPDQMPKPVLECLTSGGTRQTAALKMSADIEEEPTADGEQRYTIVYNCFDRADFECSLRLGLQLWQNPQLKWKKSCGGAARPDLVVASSLGRYDSVFAAGHAASAWMLMNPQVRLLPEEDDVTFTVHRQVDVTGSKPVVLDMPQVYSSDTRILDASITNAASVVGRVLSGDIDGATLLVHHTCKSPGFARLTVRMPADTLESSPLGSNIFGPVSFSYLKSCGGAGFMLPSVLLGFMSVACVTSAALMGCYGMQPTRE